MACTKKTVGPALLLALAVIAGGCGAVAREAPGNADWNAFADAKPVTLMGKVIRPDESDLNMLVNLTIQVSVPVLSASDTRVLRRAVSINMVTYYSAILTNFGGTLELVDATTDDAILVYGGGSDPGEAKASAMIMRGENPVYSEEPRRPKYEITIRPIDDLTWGSIDHPDDIAVSWEPLVLRR